MRVILYTGKGGVGKSSLAAATAVRVAEQGRRTLLVSSDLAHNLSDILDTEVGAETIQVAPNLAALEVDPLREIRENWGPAHHYISGLLAYFGVDDAVAEEVALYPGIDDVFVLTRILREVDSGSFDTIIVDCSPTASSMRHLTFSDSSCAKFTKVLDVERKIVRLIRPVASKIEGGREVLPEDRVYSLFEDVVGKVGRLGEMLKDPAVSSVRLVLNPDRVAIAETRRAFTYYGLFGFPVDAVFINKMLPRDLAQGYLHNWYTLQEELLESIDQSFLDVAKLRVPLLDREPIGLEPLSEIAGVVFDQRRPDDVLSLSTPVTYSSADDRPQFVFRLPNARKPGIDVRRAGSELILTAEGYTRVFSLPDTLADRDVAAARFSDGILTISF